MCESVQDNKATGFEKHYSMIQYFVLALPGAQLAGLHKGTYECEKRLQSLPHTEGNQGKNAGFIGIFCRLSWGSYRFCLFLAVCYYNLKRAT